LHNDRVELTPYSAGRYPLGGFIIAGRWPESTREWATLLTLVVRMSAVPGMLGKTTVFRTVEDDIAETGIEHPVGMLHIAGPVIGDEAPRPGDLAHPQPGAVLLLHPPDEVRTHGAAGCLLLPGLPHLGLDHRAAWVDTDSDGTVTRLMTDDEADPSQDPDTAVLALLVAA
jgi:hypothetical protein